jgi:hypothetical protein
MWHVTNLNNCIKQDNSNCLFTLSFLKVIVLCMACIVKSRVWFFFFKKNDIHNNWKLTVFFFLGSWRWRPHDMDVFVCDDSIWYALRSYYKFDMLWFFIDIILCYENWMQILYLEIIIYSLYSICHVVWFEHIKY